MFALGLLSWMYHRPHESTERFLREKFARRPDLAEANILAFRAGHAYGETTEAFAVTYEVAPAHARDRHLPPDHRQHGAGLRHRRGRAGQRAAGVPGLLPDHPGVGHPARAVQAQGVRRHHVPGRGRDRRRRRGAGRGVRRGARRHHHLRAGRLAEVRDDRAGGGAGAAAAGGRRAARRPVHRAAHQDRAGRPAAGHVRPQRRGPAADRRPALARRLLRRGAGGGPHRGHLPHAGDAAVGRLAGQRLRAVEGPRRRLAAEGRPGLRHRAQRARRVRRVLAVPARRRHAGPARGPCPAPPGLEHRIGGLEKADGRGCDLLRPDNHDRMVRLRAAKIDGITVPDVEVDDPSGDAELLVARLGLHLRPDRRRARGGSARWATRSPPPHLRHLNPLPANLGEVLARYRTRARARDEPRAAGAAAARPLPRRREELHQGLRPAVQGRGAAGPVPGLPVKGCTHDQRSIWGCRRSAASTGSPPPPTSRPPRTTPPTRRCAGAPAAATTPCSPPSASSCPRWASAARTPCSSPASAARSRFPYYLNTYGMHSIHGRAPAIATGLAVTRPDLSVWVVTGDGDALSIGGNHLIHALRRNVNLKILLFNNRIYGLTKGQYSPTSEVGQDHQVDADGLGRPPLQPGLAGARAPRPRSSGGPSTPTARASPPCCGAAAAHRGTALVEIFQDCPIFNDGSFDVLRKGDDVAGAADPGSPTASRSASARRARTAWAPTPSSARASGCGVAKADEVDESEIVVHDATRPQPRVRAVAAVRPGPHAHRDRACSATSTRPTYDDAARAQVDQARAATEAGRRRPAGPAQRPRHLDRRGLGGCWRTPPVAQ